jgi:hypothetical protein
MLAWLVHRTDQVGGPDLVHCTRPCIVACLVVMDEQTTLTESTAYDGRRHSDVAWMDRCVVGLDGGGVSAAVSDHGPFEAAGEVDTATGVDMA